jgi:hypothetical protein
VVPVVSPVSIFVTRTFDVPEPIDAKLSLTSTLVHEPKSAAVPQQKLAAVKSSAPGFISALSCALVLATPEAAIVVTTGADIYV